jgi:hypothetical protein
LKRVPSIVVADFLFFRDPATSPRPPWWRAASSVAVALFSLLPFVPHRSLAPPGALVWSDKHRNASLEIAFNRVSCGTESKLSPAFPIAEHLERHPELLDAPLRDVAAQIAGSMRRYCDSVTQPFVSGENSLMLEMALFMKPIQGLSFRELGWCLQASRVAALLFFAVVLLDGGASLLFTGTVLVLCLGILAYLGSAAYHSVYAFLPVLLVLGVAFLSFCLRHGLPLSTWGHPAAAFVAGWLSAFAVNMRSSHLPVYVSLLALYFVAGARARHRARSDRSRRSRLSWLGVGVLCAALGYGMFGFLLIRPLLQDNSGGQVHPYHSVAHPLVLGLAVPENALSKREGIVWQDSVGLDLARRVDPRVSYYREGFETALFAYYGQLWRLYPREMLGIYWQKLKIAGRSMISKVTTSPVGPIAWPLAWVPNGAVYLVLHLALFGLCLRVHWRSGSSLAFTLALVTLTGLLLQLEAALVYPIFDMTHHSSQLLLFLVVAVAAWQLLLEGLQLGVRRLHGGSRPGIERS